MEGAGVYPYTFLASARDREERSAAGPGCWQPVPTEEEDGWALE